MLSCTPPDVSLVGRYPMGEAARLLGISRHTLLIYCNEGLIKCGHYRNKRQTKYFTGRELLRFWRSR